MNNTKLAQELPTTASLIGMLNPQLRPLTSNPRKWTLLIRCESPAALAAACDHANTRELSGYNEMVGRDGWALPWTKLKKDFRAGRGDAGIADQIAAKVRTVTAGATTTSGWEMAPAGAYPIVPAAIGGDPYSMRRRTAHASEQAPVRIFLPLTCSAGVSMTAYAELMSLVVAGCVAISETRPVEMIGYVGLDCAKGPARQNMNTTEGAFFLTVPIATEFADYSALALWCDPTIGRTAGIGLARSIQCGFRGRWPWEESPTQASVIAQFREALECDTDDMLIPPAFGAEGELKALRDRLVAMAEQSGVTLNFAQEG